jgi:hypothetical protein
MARDNRKINSAVRIEVTRNANEGVTLADGSPAPVVPQTIATVYGPDKEDELAAAITPERGRQLIEAGVLEGDWEFSGSSSQQSAPQQPQGAAQPGAIDPDVLAELERLRAENEQLRQAQQFSGGGEGGNVTTPELSARTIKALEEAGIAPEATATMGDDELLDLKNFGEAALAEVRAAYPVSQG